MTTKRRLSQATSREGVNFVRALVERHNSIFHEIDLQNDIGNDAYVEFVVEENATGCCVALQIKSGSSYRVSARRCAFHSDRNHFEYWASHTLPVLAVVFDPGTMRAFWSDITDHLRKNPSLINEGPYTISVENELSDSKFITFRQHCLSYRDKYSRETNLGRALEGFASREDTERCFDGLRALFAYHRHQAATWYYLVSSLRNYRGHAVLRSLVACLSHLPGHGDIFWHKGNMINEKVRRDALHFMRERLGYQDALALLSVIDDAGIQRGTIGQCVHALIDTMADTQGVMEQVATDQTQEERIRHSAVLFALAAAQANSTDDAIAALDRIQPTVEGEELAGVVSWLREELQRHGYVFLY